MDNKIRILFIFAHCDDELICGWPLLQEQAMMEKNVLIVSSDRYHPQRQQYAHRSQAFYEVCDYLQVAGKCLDYSSDFYAMENRQSSLSRLQADLVSWIDQSWDYIFCHNPLGEYGHLDHKMIFDIVLRYSKCPIVFTDICLKTNWPSHKEIPHRLKQIYYQNKISEHVCDVEFYQELENIYRKHNVWTWDQPAVKYCNVYQLN